MADHLDEAENAAERGRLAQKRPGLAGDIAFLVADAALSGLENVVKHLRAQQRDEAGGAVKVGAGTCGKCANGMIENGALSGFHWCDCEHGRRMSAAWRGWPPKPDESVDSTHQAMTSPSGEDLRRIYTQAARVEGEDPGDYRFDVEKGERALYEAGKTEASREIAAKDARIATLETMLRDLNEATATRFGKWSVVVEAAKVYVHEEDDTLFDALEAAVQALGDDS